MLCEGNGTGALPQPPLAVNSGGGLTKKGGKGKTTCVSSSTALSLLFTSPSRSPPSIDFRVLASPLLLSASRAAPPGPFAYNLDHFWTCTFAGVLGLVKVQLVRFCTQ